ncbi:hypothetical protein GCM10010971_04720 [Silvimonas amylolytica]|uniref:DUF1615 domain-containing protein n=1 Tax=Silvimonas amylolytica TaxID=449663 RepID=A0ABQ2PH28_9NEIS|nr:hypothetical protein GCM10010971_04720 [Silvimonas amylolytica]
MSDRTVRTALLWLAATLITPRVLAADEPVMAIEPVPEPVEASVPQAASAVMPAPVPASLPAVAPQASAPSAMTPVPTPAPLQPNQAVAGDAAGRTLLNTLLPTGIPDRAGWSTDIFTAFSTLKIPYSPSYFCASIAVIAQESSFQSDPVVPGLNEIVWKEIDKRIHKFGVPRLVVQAAFAKTSPDGRSYNERIDALRTERQMNALFEDMITELPFGPKLFADDNPIRTGGPMQVGVDFAKGHVQVWPYPYKIQRSLRDEVFTRRGSVYFGTAHLLQYPTSYPEMIYRFADYNAGRYASRSAAMQLALAKITGQKLTPDGYLMSYNGAVPTNTVTDSQRALFSLSGKLGLSRQQMLADIRQERYAAFEKTATYTRVFALADKTAGKPLPRAALPQIRLISPKITRKLTTAWFAQRVDGRYQDCLGRLDNAR